jgi:excisionase family DNA binding protein
LIPRQGLKPIGALIATLAEGIHMAERNTEDLLTPAEVAKLFRVDPKTVTRWAKSGKLSSIRTLGGHRRYSASEIRNLLWTAGTGFSELDVHSPRTARAEG